MKKLAKILVLFLVMALIAGAFALTTLGDEAGTTTVGTYTPKRLRRLGSLQRVLPLVTQYGIHTMTTKTV